MDINYHLMIKMQLSINQVGDLLRASENQITQK